MIDKCLCTTLRQAAAYSTARYDHILSPSGLKVTMFRLLRRIDEVGQVTITGLAELVDLDRSTLGRNLRVLEKANLIRMTTGRDERSREIVLTHTGRSALDTARPLWAVAQAEFADLITPDVAEALAVLAGRSGQTKASVKDR